MEEGIPESAAEPELPGKTLAFRKQSPFSTRSR